MADAGTLAQIGACAPEPMDSAEAFAAIALGAVACDGVLGKDEAHALRRQLEFRTPYNQRTEAAMGELFDRLLKILRDQGLDVLVAQSLQSLNNPQQETALALAAQLVHADRVVEVAETEFLNKLCDAMTLPEGQARGIVAAIMALNRDSLAS